jgi:tetratricopeptide (TPR) repeat protein
LSTMRFLAYLLLFGFSACGQQTDSKKSIIDPKARKLNDSATTIVMKQQDYAKAISLLDQATEIDRNFLTAYVNKLSFQLQLKQFEKALQTALKLKELKPTAPDYYVTIGMVYSYKGDSALAKDYFTEATKRYDAVLDTMKKVNKAYDLLLMNKAVNLILVGQQQEGSEILKQLYTKEKNDINREMIALFMNKSKQEILESLIKTN